MVANGHMIHMDIALDHDLREIPQTQRIPKVTSYAQDDDLCFKMSPFEQRGPLSSYDSQA